VNLAIFPVVIKIGLRLVLGLVLGLGESYG
jgi:hypothetical protein